MRHKVCQKGHKHKRRNCPVCNKAFRKRYKKRGGILSKRLREGYRTKAINRLGGKCKDCGNGDPRVLEFDHVEKKSYNISSVCYVGERFEQELKKCELVCANCHKIRTRGRMPALPPDDYVPRQGPITANGKTMTCKEWSDFLRIPYFTLNGRRVKGWSDHDIINTPVRRGKPRKQFPETRTPRTPGSRQRKPR